MRKHKKNILLYRTAGISGVIVGIYMLLYLHNKGGIVPLSVGLGILLWKFKHG